MSGIQHRSGQHAVDPAVIDGGMPATTDICVALVVALVVYVLGCAVFQQDVAAAASQGPGAAGISFVGP